MDPRLCILGLGEGIDGMPGVTKAVLRCLFQARKLIAQRWKAKKPSTVREWVSIVTEMIWREKTVYTRRRNIKDFKKVWGPWLERMGYPM